MDQNFALIKDLRSKIPTNAYFGHQRAVKLGNLWLKTFKGPSLSLLDAKIETLLPSNASTMTKSL